MSIRFRVKHASEPEGEREMQISELHGRTGFVNHGRTGRVNRGRFESSIVRKNAQRAR